MNKKLLDSWNLFRNHLQSIPSRKSEVIFLIMMILMIAGLILYYLLTSNTPQYVLPPKFNTENQTYEKVLLFIKSDDTNTIPYGEGFNCLNSVLRVWQNAAWQGIVSVPVTIQFEEPPGHMVIGFPTCDRGDVFFETENDQKITLNIGDKYIGQKIRGFYAIDFEYIPLAGSPEYDPSIVIK